MNCIFICNYLLEQQKSPLLGEVTNIMGNVNALFYNKVEQKWSWGKIKQITINHYESQSASKGDMYLIGLGHCELQAFYAKSN